MGPYFSIFSADANVGREVVNPLSLSFGTEVGRFTYVVVLRWYQPFPGRQT